MTPESTSARLISRLNAADSPEDVLQVLTELRAVPRNHPEAASLAALEERAFESIRRLTDAAPAAAALQAEVLPRCLEYDTSNRDTPWPSYAELFGEWLKELPLRYQLEVRSVALASAETAFNSGNIPGGLRVVAQLGYADSAVCQRLENLLATHDDDLGDRVLGVRMSLGTSPEARTRLRQSLHQRLQQRGTYRLFDAAKRIGDTQTADLILDKWLAPVASGESCFDDLVALGALAAISARESDGSAATYVWRRIQEIAARVPGGKLISSLDMGVITHFATPEVIPDLLNRLAVTSGIGRWIIYSRLKECLHPKQLPGWDTPPTGSIEVVGEDAIATVADRGRVMTENMRQKEEAWQLLLCVGRTNLLPSIGKAVEGNASGHATHAFLELAACLGFVPLPDIVSAIISGESPDSAWSRDELLIAQVGAVRTANALMSDQAFEALLRYQPVGDGILVSVIDALAEVARGGTASGDRSRIGTLLCKFSDAQASPTTRSASGAALAKLLEAGILTSDEEAQLADLASENDVDPYTRRALLYAFASRPEVQVPAKLLSLADSLTRSTRVLSDEERKASLAPAALMLYASRLSENALSTFQAGRLGLTESGGQVHASDLNAIPAVVYHLVAQWYDSDPVRYAPAMAALLQTEDPRRLAPLTTVVRRVGTGNPPVVADALITRAHRLDGGREAEPFVLELLAEVAPEKLVSNQWIHLERWLPQARAAMADAVGRIRNDRLRKDSERLLIRLACDGVFGVRRSAFRAFSELAPEAFEALAVGWATFDGDRAVELRRQAAEAYRWMRRGDAMDSMLALDWDPEPQVREAFRRAANERREAEWAENYTQQVISADATTDVVRLWRYGSALARFGDDQTIERLRLRARGLIPPNVRFWLDRIRKTVQTRWDEVVRKWPDPWFTRRGRYEVVDAVIVWGDGSEAVARTHLWFAASEQPNGIISWGGWAEVTDSTLANSLKRAFGGTIGTGREQLVVHGRSPTEILVTRQFSGNGSRIVFSGNGPYPEDKSES